MNPASGKGACPRAWTRGWPEGPDEGVPFPCANRAFSIGCGSISGPLQLLSRSPLLASNSPAPYGAGPGPAKRVARAKKPRRRRQADVAPTPQSCQLATRPAHCRFEPFQWDGVSDKTFLRFRRIPAEVVAQAQDRLLAGRTARPPARGRGRAERRSGRRRERHGASSLGAFRRTNIAQSTAFANNFHSASRRNRRGADPAPPSRRSIADIDRTVSPTAAPVRIAGSLVSRSREVFPKSRGFISKNSEFLRERSLPRFTAPSRLKRP